MKKQLKELLVIIPMMATLVNASTYSTEFDANAYEGSQNVRYIDAITGAQQELIDTGSQNTLFFSKYNNYVNSGTLSDFSNGTKTFRETRADGVGMLIIGNTTFSQDKRRAYMFIMDKYAATDLNDLLSKASVKDLGLLVDTMDDSLCSSKCNNGFSYYPAFNTCVGSVDCPTGFSFDPAQEVCVALEDIGTIHTVRADFDYESFSCESPAVPFDYEGTEICKTTTIVVGIAGTPVTCPSGYTVNPDSMNNNDYCISEYLSNKTSTIHYKACDSDSVAVVITTDGVDETWCKTAEVGEGKSPTCAQGTVGYDGEYSSCIEIMECSDN